MRNSSRAYLNFTFFFFLLFLFSFPTFFWIENCKEDAKYHELFMCDDGMCIPKKLKNNGKFNCVDRSDENENEVIRGDLQLRKKDRKKFTLGPLSWSTTVAPAENTTETD